MTNNNYTLDEAAAAIHKTAIEHGWEDETRSFGDWIALGHSELSEALEYFRNGKPLGAVWERSPDRKPEGILVELADTVIRCLHHMHAIMSENVVFDDKTGSVLKMTVGDVIAWKMRFNETRPYRHGGKMM